jgi:hypothetical protein
LEPPVTALTLPQRAAVALDSAKHRQNLAELVKKSTGIVAVLNSDAREEAHRAGMVLKNTRVAIQKRGKEAREDATAFSKAVIAEEKALIDMIEPEETRVLGLRDKWDADREAERQAKIEAERQRITAIRVNIHALRIAPLGIAGKSSSVILAARDAVRDTIIDESYAEFREEAMSARSEAFNALEAAFDAAAAQEAEAARLISEREELARLRVEAEQHRAEQEAEDALIISFQRAATRIEFDSVPYIKKASLQYESTGGDWENDPRPRVAAAFLAGRAYLKDRLEAAEKRAAEDAALKAEREKQETELAAQRAEAARQQAERDDEAARQARAAKEAQDAAQAKLDAERAELDQQRAEIEAEKRLRDEAEAERIAAVIRIEEEEVERVRLQAAHDQVLADATTKPVPAVWPFPTGERPIVENAEEFLRRMDEKEKLLGDTKENVPSRPDDEEIIKVIADHFGVQENIAYGWLLELSQEIEYQ